MGGCCCCCCCLYSMLAFRTTPYHHYGHGDLKEVGCIRSWGGSHSSSVITTLCIYIIQIAWAFKNPINGLERQLFHRFQHVEPNRSPWCQHDRQEVFWPLWPCVPDLFVGVRQPKGRMCSQKCPHVIILESIPHHSPNFSSIGPLHLNHSNRTPLHFQWHSIQVISSLQRHRQRLRHRLRRHRLRRYRLRRLRRVTDVVLAALGPVFFKDPQPPQQQRLGAAPWTKEAAVATAPLQCDEVQRAVDIQFPGIDALKERKSKGAKIWCVLLSFQVFFALNQSNLPAPFDTWNGSKWVGLKMGRPQFTIIN